ncbi:TPA: ATP-binding protein [Burkholderia cenocepacia]|nr:ATP-binding protein [Burkholderia cenocepacia]HDR9809129.1 ATP-binding protein [Burkholderia cenocepacia]HDR9817119.1 ATP-binding protein [Burkholderia cenocepacia]HDR9831947.1 ATP-binding protein [Burkholderia cenocepacia]
MQIENRLQAASSNDAVLLHMACGKIASGKSTLTARLASAARTVLISEDVWLARLYPGEILSIDDYVRCATRIKDVMADHVCSLLKAGVSVVLDFPFNTVAARAWGHDVSKAAGCGHRLHFLDVGDAVCKARLHARNARGDHPFQASDAEFEQITQYFVAPGVAEGLYVVTYGEAEAVDTPA